MHFSYYMHLLTIVLFSLFLSCTADDYPESYNEYEHTTTPITTGITTESVSMEEPIEKIEAYSEKWKFRPTTTPVKKTTESFSEYHDAADHEIYDDEDDEDTVYHGIVSHTTPKVTTLSSSSTFRQIRLDTTTTTETTTTTSETTSVTRSFRTFSTVAYEDFYHGMFFTSTIDPKVVAASLARANRDRLFLKIFAITVVVCMLSLAVALITIHMVRKTRPYRGYRPPANASSNQQSKHLNDIKA